MPLYEYRCGKCGEVFEQLVSAGKKDAKVQCPKCNSKKTKRQFSCFAIGNSNAASSLPSCASGTCPTGTCPFADN